MKKLLLIAMIMASVPIFSQVHVGVYAGPNFTNVNITSPGLDSDTRIGFQAGAFFRAGKFLYGQAGLEYQIVRSEFSGMNAIDIYQEDEVGFSSLNIPLYAGLNLLPITERIVNVRIYAGPTTSFLLAVPVNQLDFERNDFSEIKITGTLGAGLDILLFSLDLGYNFGMSDLFRDVYQGKANYAFINAGLKF